MEAHHCYNARMRTHTGPRSTCSTSYVPLPGWILAAMSNRPRYSLTVMVAPQCKQSGSNDGSGPTSCLCITVCGVTVRQDAETSTDVPKRTRRTDRLVIEMGQRLELMRRLAAWICRVGHCHWNMLHLLHPTAAAPARRTPRPRRARSRSSCHRTWLRPKIWHFGVFMVCCRIYQFLNKGGPEFNEAYNS